MPTSVAKKQVTRVKKSLNYILKKLKVKYLIGVYAMEEKHGEERTADEASNLIEVCRSDRGQQDKATFLVFVNSDMLAKMPVSDIHRHVFHEICHIMSWEYTDEMENMLKYIEEGPLKDELVNRMIDVRENVTYTFERTFGPFVLPTLNWDDI
jgi:hypothetical protein